MQSRLITLFLALAGALLAAQPRVPAVLVVGDARIDVARIGPYHARWRETIVNAVHQVIERGTWDDRLTQESQGGRDVLVRTINVSTPAGAMREYYRTVVDAGTFEPVESEWRNNQGLSYAYTYAGTAATGHRVNAAGSGAVKISAVVPRPAFDYYGGMMELFLATLPREPHSLFSFPAMLTTSGYDADQSGLHWPVVEVFPEETTRGAAGAPIKATRIEANTKYGFYKVWVTDAPPYVVRTVLLLGPGGRITYELQ